MPFSSQAQRGYLYANKPKVAAEMQSKTPANADLPARAAPAMAPAKPMARPAPTPERKKLAMQSMVAKYGKQG